MLPLTVGGELYLVVAPRGLATRRIMAVVDDRPELARRIRFTTSERLTAFVFRHGGRHRRPRRQWAWRDVAASVRGAAALARQYRAGGHRRPGRDDGADARAGADRARFRNIAQRWCFSPGLACGSPVWSSTAARGPAAAPARRRTSGLHGDCRALSRGTSVDGLFAAIERLGLSAGKTRREARRRGRRRRDARRDRALRAAASRLRSSSLPAAGPRTKPKALNVALPFARGSFTVIYDAEDRPEAGQLRRALQAFVGRRRAISPACRPASPSTTRPTAGSPRLFTAEYAGQFDVFLPGIAALRLPLPLGGSSNHFRTATLRKVGGWDPYNVTEDADLGMRLARFGYRAAMIDSTTYEEAPARFRPWLRQRTRWFKGWMQTWLVHMREPRRLLRDLGLPGFLAFQLVVGGNALAALVHPLFLAGLVYGVLIGAPMWKSGGAAAAHPRRALWRDGGDRLCGLGLARLGRACPPRPAVDRLGAAAHAAALAAAVARGLARARPAHRRALSLGEDRARPRAKLAARAAAHACSVATGASASRPEGKRRPAGAAGRASTYISAARPRTPRAAA